MGTVYLGMHQEYAHDAFTDVGDDSRNEERLGERGDRALQGRGTASRKKGKTRGWGWIFAAQVEEFRSDDT
jgi:hypothetical protein